MRHTLVTFHAHPDDEALLTAGTMAKAADAGHRVVAVFATDGEAGEADPAAFGTGGALGGHRRAEAEAAAAILGVERVVFLGYPDSGSSGVVATPAGGPAPLAARPAAEVAERLAALLAEESADVVTVYDRHGGYGHPDHVQVHRAGLLAAEGAGTPVVLEATISRELLRAGAELATAMGYELGAGFQPDSFDAWYLPEAEITTVVDVTGQLDRKRAAMLAHASQATSGADAPGAPGGAGAPGSPGSPGAAGAPGAAAAGTVRSLAVFASLPDDLFALAFAREWFVRRGAPPAGPDDDVFAGLA